MLLQKVARLTHYQIRKKDKSVPVHSLVILLVAIDRGHVS